jgi:hypothetical protein
MVRGSTNRKSWLATQLKAMRNSTAIQIATVSIAMMVSTAFAMPFDWSGCLGSLLTGVCECCVVPDEPTQSSCCSSQKKEQPADRYGHTDGEPCDCRISGPQEMATDAFVNGYESPPSKSTKPSSRHFWQCLYHDDAAHTWECAKAHLPTGPPSFRLFCVIRC